MHEMSIVTSILQIVEDQALAAGARVINSIELDVGQLAGIEVDSLQFCFEAARGLTLAAQAKLVIHEIPGLGRCPDCARDVPMDYPVGVCPHCGEALLEVFQGRELRVRSINVD